MRKLGLVVMMASLIASAGCGATVSSYVKPDAPWSVIKRMAILPFQLPSENPVQRQLITELFGEELRRSAPSLEIVDVPLSSPVGSGVEGLQAVGREYKVDAVITGSLDETQGTVIHVRVHDVATEDLLWSGTYLLGSRAEFLSLATRQQQFKKAFARLVRQLVHQISSSQ